MTATLVPQANTQVWREIVAPAAQASANDPAVVAGSEIDARGWSSLAYTILNADNTVTWWVYGANASDYSDEVIVDGPSDVAAAAADSYAVAQAPYAYYRVKIESKVDGAHGNVTVVGIAKP
jgi:hypothetical protein